MKNFFLIVVITILLSSCTKTKYSISGTAQGIADGKTIIMETQNDMGTLVPVDTVKVKDGKFEITGKAVEPSFHLLQVEGIEGKVLFILENDNIKIEINKDSIVKSKVSGSYNNDEYVIFNEELMKIQKSLLDFQKNNTPAMNKAQQSNDTAMVGKLMKEYGKLQETANTASKAKYQSYAETHPKSFISVLIVQGMTKDPNGDMSKVEKLFNTLDSSLKSTKPGKEIDSKIKAVKNPAVGTNPGAAPAATPK